MRPVGLGETRPVAVDLARDRLDAVKSIRLAREQSRGDVQVKGFDRRRHKRYLVTIPAKVSLGRKVLAGETIDVSFGGLFVGVEADAPLRQLGRLQLELPPDGRRFDCHVMTVHALGAMAEGGWRPGVGLQLFALDSAAAAVWTSFIRYEQLRAPEAVSRNRPQPGPGAAAPQRREFNRTPARLELRLDAAPDAPAVYSRDVSAGGMFVKTDLDLPVGAALVIEVVHAGTMEAFPIDAVVRWRNQRPENAGLGVEFVGLDEARRQQFFEFVRSEAVALEAESPDEAPAVDILVPVELLALVGAAPGAAERPPVRASVVELGAAGLRLEAATPIDDEEVLVRFALPGEREPLAVRCSGGELLDEDLLRYSFAFERLEDRARERIQAFVHTRVWG